jgi:hypothetical protein
MSLSGRQKTIIHIPSLKEMFDSSMMLSEMVKVFDGYLYDSQSHIPDQTEKPSLI